MTLTLKAAAPDFLDPKTPIPANSRLAAGQKGQASLEFLLTFAFGIGMTLLFVSLAINMTRGYLVHYANFMASRVFLSHDIGNRNDMQSNLNAAERKASEVFQRYPLGTFDIAPDFKVNKPTMNVASSLMGGSTATFQEKMTPFSLVGGSNGAFFHSESFLTKEPVRLQCLQSVCEAMGLNGLNDCNGSMDITVFDNGC